MKALVTFAIGEEFSPWRGRHRFAAVRVGDQTLHQARIGEAEVTVLLTGIGPRRAAAAVAGILMSQTGGERAFDVCIATGLAGGLRREFAAGEILAACAVVREGENKELRPGDVVSHPKCLELAGECGARIVERFRTSGRVILTAWEKEQLSATAAAVEMESFDVLTEAMAWGVPGIAIRAVGDTAGEDLPLDFNQVLTPRGTISVGGIAAALLKKPSALPGLLRFARQSRDAAISLADYLDRFVAALATRVSPSELMLEEAVAAT